MTEDGRAGQLPRLGLHAWENTVPADNRTSNTTLVIGQEDRSSDAGPMSQVWIYVGAKTDSGDAFDRAGLTNGKLYVADVADQAVSTDAEFRAAYKDDFYFTTTEGGAGATDERDGGGVWRLRLEDRDDPAAGAALELLLDGSEPPLLHKPDNLALDHRGNLLIQEDPGSDPHAARAGLRRGRRGHGVVAQFDPAHFSPAAAGFITDDESPTEPSTPSAGSGAAGS